MSCYGRRAAPRLGEMRLEGDHTQTPPGRAEGPREEQGWSPPKNEYENPRARPDTSEQKPTPTQEKVNHSTPTGTQSGRHQEQTPKHRTQTQHPDTQGEPHTESINKVHPQNESPSTRGKGNPEGATADQGTPGKGEDRRRRRHSKKGTTPKEEQPEVETTATRREEERGDKQDKTHTRKEAEVSTQAGNKEGDPEIPSGKPKSTSTGTRGRRQRRKDSRPRRTAKRIQGVQDQGTQAKR